MAYTAPTFQNGNAPAINATNLNNLARAVQSLQVPNGGTGSASFTSGAILVGDGTDPIDELSGVGAVYSETSGSPQFGVLPITYGGTGASSVAQLKENLGLTKSGFVVQSSAPSDTNVLWIDSTNRTLKFFNGSAWTPIVGVYGTGA